MVLILSLAAAVIAGLIVANLVLIRFYNDVEQPFRYAVYAGCCAATLFVVGRSDLIRFIVSIVGGEQSHLLIIAISFAVTVLLPVVFVYAAMGGVKYWHRQGSKKGFSAFKNRE